jgi:tRNA dimethylallyltransferase
MPPRPALYGALEARFDAMLSAGAIDEVRALLALGLDANFPAMKALGVREIAGYLRGESSLQEAAALAKQATRRFAKRQITWLRHQLHPDFVLNEHYSERNGGDVFAFIHPLLTHDA